MISLGNTGFTVGTHLLLQLLPWHLFGQSFAWDLFIPSVTSSSNYLFITVFPLNESHLSTGIFILIFYFLFMYTLGSRLKMVFPLGSYLYFPNLFNNFLLINRAYIFDVLSILTSWYRVHLMDSLSTDFELSWSISSLGF